VRWVEGVTIMVAVALVVVVGSVNDYQKEQQFLKLSKKVRDCVTSYASADSQGRKPIAWSKLSVLESFNKSPFMTSSLEMCSIFNPETWSPLTGSSFLVIISDAMNHL
jgi:predicted small integral membrane protein